MNVVLHLNLNNNENNANVLSQSLSQNMKIKLIQEIDMDQSSNMYVTYNNNDRTICNFHLHAWHDRNPFYTTMSLFSVPESAFNPKAVGCAYFIGRILMILYHYATLYSVKWNMLLMSQTSSGTHQGMLAGVRKECASTPPCCFWLKTESLAQTDDLWKCIHHERNRSCLSSDAFALIRRIESLSSPLFFRRS